MKNLKYWFIRNFYKDVVWYDPEKLKGFKLGQMVHNFTYQFWHKVGDDKIWVRNKKIEKWNS